MSFYYNKMKKIENPNENLLPLYLRSIIGLKIEKIKEKIINKEIQPNNIDEETASESHLVTTEMKQISTSITSQYNNYINKTFSNKPKNNFISKRKNLPLKALDPTIHKKLHFKHINVNYKNNTKPTHQRKINTLSHNNEFRFIKLGKPMFSTELFDKPQLTTNKHYKHESFSKLPNIYLSKIKTCFFTNNDNKIAHLNSTRIIKLSKTPLLFSYKNKKEDVKKIK